MTGISRQGDTVKLARFVRKRPTVGGGTETHAWVGATYGARAEMLLAALPARMRAAEEEAVREYAWPEDAVPESHGGERTNLENDLRELRDLTLEAVVAEGNRDRDLRLRASLSVAVGAARTLALATPSRPTVAYVRLAKAAVEDVLSAVDGRLG